MPHNPAGLPLEYTYNNQRNRLQNRPTLLWKPQHPESTPIARYRQHVNRKFALNLNDSHQLHQWSVTNPHDFWIDLYEYTEIIPPLAPSTKVAYDDTIEMADIAPFFPHHKLNYAENVLVPNVRKHPDAVALIGLREGHIDDPERVTWSELWELVRMTRSALIRSGVKEHDVVAVLMANSIWTVVIFLSTASIGAYFTSISPDMGLSGCVSRLSQVKPKILFADVDFAIRGSRQSLADKVGNIHRHFIDESSPAPLTVIVPTSKRPHEDIQVADERLGASLKHFLDRGSSSDQLTFTRIATSHPMFILYSSGTTGSPKCILSPHMSVLNFKKIATLHNSLSSSSVVFQYSSTSWVVWNVMIGHLSVGATLVTYDGGALYPSPATLLQICERYKVTYWGTSPRYLLELEQSAQAGISPRNHDMSHLRMVTTTGATLTGPQMRWFYTVFPPTVHLSSIAGGTEITSSWVASDPAGPLHENEMQMWALGHDCDVADSDTGESLISNSNQMSSKHGLVVGELVCRKPLPSLPVGFWNDPTRRKYREAYFERFPRGKGASGQTHYLDVWAQHDITSYNPATHGVQITARSDSTLNPSGIRFGPSEIYSILSSPHTTLKDRISDALCVGRKRQDRDKDETVFLFLIPQKGYSIDEALAQQVRDEIGRGLSQRHIPKFIIGMPEASIPYTVNGKKVEVIVKKIISGDVQVDSEGHIVGGKPGAAGSVSTITNPRCLSLYSKYKDIERATTHRARL